MVSAVQVRGGTLRGSVSISELPLAPAFCVATSPQLFLSSPQRDSDLFHQRVNLEFSAEKKLSLLSTWLLTFQPICQFLVQLHLASHGA